MEVFVVVLIIMFFFVFPAIGRAVGGASRRRGPHGELIGHGTFRNAYAGIIYVIQQQHVGVIERMGKFHQIVGPGLHVRAPFIDRVIDVSLMTEDEHVTFDAKTADNVTIELDVSIQYHVDYSQRADGTNGIYQSLYTLTDPVSQMRDYFADALRSQIPARTLDEVFSEKDAIASAIDDVVSAKMLAYGYTIVTTLITSIKLPADVQQSMNRIIASKNDLESAKNEAEAERQKTVIAATAKAEAMEKEGEGIAKQRVAIARGIRDSIDTIQGSTLTEGEANRLFEFTQWVGMMEEYAQRGASTVILPNDFEGTQSMFTQMLAADEVKRSKE
ncbi:MAG: SPFH domain-containing protein [Atopobiaceae bacterium]|nr:SPFH domain-containing protein [Atopobiaceae bacterium]